MKEPDIDKILNELINEMGEEVLTEAINERVLELDEMLNSGEAKEFTRKMNETFRKNETKDENGDLVQLSIPSDMVNKLIWNSDGRTAVFELTVEEDRWFRADALYGKNLLDALGFKYIVVKV